MKTSGCVEFFYNNILRFRIAGLLMKFHSIRCTR